MEREKGVGAGVRVAGGARLEGRRCLGQVERAECAQGIPRALPGVRCHSRSASCCCPAAAHAPRFPAYQHGHEVRCLAWMPVGRDKQDRGYFALCNTEEFIIYSEANLDIYVLAQFLCAALTIHAIMVAAVSCCQYVHSKMPTIL
eukprot:925739-Pelagomonas_calceolata.AAC.3